MFVENYRLEEPPLGGGTGHTNEAIPYPTISDEDWKVWTAFLPVRTEIDEEFLSGASPLMYAQTLPPKVRHELKRANRFLVILSPLLFNARYSSIPRCIRRLFRCWPILGITTRTNQKPPTMQDPMSK